MRTPTLAGASALALSLAPAAAPALTPEAAWRSWQDAAGDAGVALEVGGRDLAGDTLTLSGVAFAAETEDGMTVTGSMEEVVFAGQGDGSVAVTLPDSYPVTLSGPDEAGGTGRVALTIAHPGLSLVMSDAEEGGVATDYAAPEIAVTIDEVAEDGAVQDLSGGVTMTDVTGRNARTGGDLPRIEGVFSAGAVAAALDGTDPESGGRFDMEIAAADVRSESTGTLTPFYAANEDLSTLIENGFSVEGEGGSGAITFALSTEGMPESVDAQARIAGTDVRGRIDDERLDYDITYSGIEFSASGSEIPLPQVAGGLEELRTRLSIPSVPTEEAQPMALTVALRDLVLGEAIWSVFDPAGALPRDPATLVLDIAGRLRFLAQPFSEEAMAGAETPAELQGLDLNELRLSLMGARLTGTGAVTFDYDTPGPFGPDSPAPDGEVNLRLEGAQELLQTLVRTGLLAEEQAMTMRMMTGMIAQPAPEGGDVLTSEIVVRPDGTVLANGAPLPF